MKILNKLTIKHLIMNKKRTLTTIIGITLSTALMLGLGLLFSSLLTTERQDAIKTYGSYNLYLEDLNAKEISTIKKNVNVSKVYYYTPLGFAKTDSNFDAKPFLYVTETNEDFFNKLSLLEGHFPQNNNEIVIGSNLTDYSSNYKVGDTINLEIGSRITPDGELDITSNDRLATSWHEDEVEFISESINVKMTKTYQIVGIVDTSHFESYNAAGVMAFSYNATPPSIFNTYIEFKQVAKTYELASELIKSLELQDKNSALNKNLLYYYGATGYSNINSTFIPLIIIALSVISVGCIIVIYNSFAISTLERKKTFGLFSSIGATNKQIRHTVFFEAFIVGLIGLSLGIIGAFLGIYIVIQVLNSLLKDSLSLTIIFSVEPLYVIIPLIFMVIVIFLSAYLPAKRSGKITPIEAIHGLDDIKISPKEVRSPKIIQKLFGIEGVIAHKNIKRNKKKYRITIISLFISIVMFNTFTSFLGYFIKTSDSFDYFDYDIGLTLKGDKETVMKDFTTLENKYKPDKSLAMYTYYLDVTNLKAEDFTPVYQNTLREFDTSYSNLTFNIAILPDSLYNKISNTEAVLLNAKYITTYSMNNRKTIDAKVFAKNKYTLEYTMNDKPGTLNAEVLNNDIYGFKNTKYDREPYLLISESTYQTKIGFNNEVYASYVLSSSKYHDIYTDLENDKVKLNSKLHYYSPAQEMANTKNIILAVKILFYGFISLISLIGVTSVINTINTNINLRKKEFAMLRSIGLTPRGFNKLLFFESLFFGLKSLIYGIPVSLAINILISLYINNVMETSLIIPYGSILISILAVFLVVLITMNYASKKIKKDNILESLREENI